MMRVLIFTLCFLCGTGAAWACNVPVFRFALERWEADKYVVTLYGFSKLNEDQKKSWEAFAPGHANVIASPFTPDSAPEGEPEVAVSFPANAEKGEEPRVMWKGKLEQGTLEGLLDSPKRREIAKRLLAGDSVVWVVLESGDKAKDDAAAGLVTAEIAKSEAEEKLREDRLGPPAIELSAKVPVKVAYSVVRVSRGDEAEKWFVRMLLGLYPELAESKETVVFPVFGRGRVLGAAAGGEIRRTKIAKGCEFLAGDCACEIKEQNPGKDLLMAVDWESELGTRVVMEKPWPELTGVSLAAATMPTTAPLGPKLMVKGITVEQDFPLWQIVVSVLVGLGVAVGVVTVLILWRRRAT